MVQVNTLSREKSFIFVQVNTLNREKAFGFPKGDIPKYNKESWLGENSSNGRTTVSKTAG